MAVRIAMALGAAVVALAGSFAQGLAMAEPPEGPALTCALVELDRSPVAALVEAKLLDDASRNWLERLEVERILKEQELQALLGAEAGPSRVRLGQLLKADILVFLRSGEKAGERGKVQYLEIIVCETRRGLRLLSRSVPLGQQAEADADAVAGLVGGAIERFGGEIKEVCAVPPFISQDLTYEHDYLKAAYAKLIEEALLNEPGVLVVELAEAEAVAREVKLAGDSAAIQRQLPLYVLGEYRTSRADESYQVNVKLKLQRGEQAIETLDQTLPAEQVPQYLLTIAAKVTLKDKSRQHVASSAVEAKQLSERAREFARLTNWPEALALAEASLLLDRQQPDTLHDAILALGQMVPSRGPPGTVSARRATLQDRHRAFEHLAALLSHDAALAEYWRAGNFQFVHSLFTPLRTTTNPSLPDDVRSLQDQIEREEQSIAGKLAHWFASQGLWHPSAYFLNAAVRTLEPRQQYAARANMVLQYQNLPGSAASVSFFGHAGYTVQRLDSVEGREFLDQLATSPLAKPEIRQAAERLQQQLETTVTKWYAPAAVTSQASTAEPLGPTRVSFRPLQIEILHADGRIEKLQHASQWLAGDGFDIMSDSKMLGIMKTAGRIKPLWTSPAYTSEIRDIIYDGRYIWGIITSRVDPPKLLAADPKSEQVWEVTQQDGLPVLSPETAPGAPRWQVLRAVPVAPGQICVVGGFGRSWIALVSLEDGRPKVDVFHEARERHNEEDREQWKQTTVAFQPSYIVAVSGQADAAGEREQRVIIGRTSNRAGLDGHPLLVDPARKTVEVAQGNWWDPKGGGIFDGALYQVLPDPPSWSSLSVYRIVPPELDRTAVIPRVKDGVVIFSDDQLHIVGKQWWTGKLSDEQLTNAGDVPWHYESHWGTSGPRQPFTWTRYDYRLGFIAVSNYYGMIVYYYNQAPDGRKLAQIVLEDAPEPSSPREAVPARAPPVANTELSRTESNRVPTAQFIAAGAGQPSRTLGQQRFGPNTRLAYSPDGKLLVTWPSVQLWDADGKLLGWLDIDGAAVEVLSISNDCRSLAVGLGDGSVLLWSLQQQSPPQILQGHKQGILAMDFSADGKWLATSSSDLTIRVWDLRTGTQMLEFPARHNYYHKIAFSPDARLLATSGREGVEFYDLIAGKCDHRTETLRDIEAFLPDGAARGHVADAAGSLIAWDPKTRTSRGLLASPRGRVMAISPSGKYAAVQEAQQVIGDRIDTSRRLIVWDLHSRREVALSAGPDHQVAAVAFTPDEKRLAVISWLGPVRLWDLTTGTEFAEQSESR